jgi:hypothetical protein
MWHSARWRVVSRRLYPLALIFLLPVGSDRQSHASTGKPKPIEAGMVALLADPQRYDGKFIRTIGYACLEYENDALYLHAEDYRHSILGNYLELRLEPAQRKQFRSLSLKYVIVEGTMHSNEPGPFVEYPGWIGNITRFDYWRPRGDIPAPPEEPASGCSPCVRGECGN